MTDFSHHEHTISDLGDFDAISFFRHLTECNKLARHYGFQFKVVSGLDGFDDALHGALDMTAMVAVDDTSDGGIDITNTPHKKAFRTVFLFMRHTLEENADEAREECFQIMRELFRQFASVLIRERTRLRLENVIINDNIAFHEIDKYFFTGGACAWFQIEFDKFVSLELRPEEWLQDPIPSRISTLDVNSPRPLTKQC